MTTAAAGARHRVVAARKPGGGLGGGLGGAVTGAPSLLRFVLRRDRIRLPVWIGSLVVITYASAQAVAATYDTPEKVAAYARNMGTNPATVAMAGPPVALDQLGGVLVYETSFTALFGVALMAAFTVVRHTRAEEEVGRTELISSTVVGRHAGSLAAVVVAVAASVLVGLGVTLSVVGEAFPLDSALLYGAAVAALGVVFAAIAAVAVQMVTHARTASGIAVGALGVSFGLRAIGDVQENGLSWLSPMGWSQQVRALGGDRWWPLLVSLSFSAVLLAAAAWLTTRRDIGAGVIAARPGAATAPASLSSPFGLTWRLQRWSLLAWAVLQALLASVFGFTSRQLQDMVDSNPTLQKYFETTGGSITDAFFATALLFAGLIAAAFAVTSVLRIRAEEDAGRLESVLATGVSRPRALLGPLAVTVAGTVVLMLAGALGVGVADWMVTGDGGTVPELLALCLVELPAVWVLTGLAVALVGWLPRLTILAWVALTLAFVVGWLGGLLKLPAWIEDLSPFKHLPQVPVEDVTVTPLVVLTVLAVALVVAGTVGFRRRDLLTA
jgi:ABC-2 type transport system permease protein